MKHRLLLHLSPVPDKRCVVDLLCRDHFPRKCRDCSPNSPFKKFFFRFFLVNGWVLNGLGRRVRGTRPTANRAPQSQRASVLYISLWALIILSVLSLALANIVSAQMRFSNFFVRSVVSLPLVKIAYYSALSERSEDTKKQKKDEEKEPKKIRDFDSEKLMLSPREKRFEGGLNYKYFFEDEGSRININTASVEVLEKLPGMDEDLAKSIIDSNLRPFGVKEELLLVEDITQEIFDKLKDSITVYGDGKININTVSKEVLFALGLEEELIDALMRFRKGYIGKDDLENTEDDGAFTAQDGMLNQLREFTMLSLSQEMQLLSAKNSFSVKSNIVRLKVFTAINAKSGNTYSIVMDPRNKKILSWQEL